MNSEQNDVDGSQEPPNEQTHTSPRLNVLDVALAGVSLALFTLLVVALLIFGPLPESNRGFVTIYCAILVALIASPISGQLLHVELDAPGIRIRAIGGFAAFVLVFFFDPGSYGWRSGDQGEEPSLGTNEPQPIGPIEEPNAIDEQYFRVFGAVEATTLIRILATRGGSPNDPITRDDIGWCPDADVSVEQRNEDYMEAVYNGWCSLAATEELLDSFRKEWDYPEARFLRTDLVKSLTDDPKMAQALLFQGNSFSEDDQKCLLKYVLNRPLMTPVHIEQELSPASDDDHDASCEPNPSRRIGFLGLVLRNRGDQPIDYFSVRGSSLRLDDRPTFKDLYAQVYNLAHYESANHSENPRENDRTWPDLERWAQVDQTDGPTFGGIFRRNFEEHLTEGGYHLWAKDPSFEGEEDSYQAVGLEPGDSIIILIGAYEANEEGFEREPITDIFVPQIVEYSLGGDQTYTERLREPARGSVEESRTNFEGEWGWVQQ